jgi:hypothetical protein
LTVLGVGEAVIRTRFEGMMTDVSGDPATQRGVHLYGIDLDSAGNSSDRDWGTIGVDPGPPLGAVKGRWRFRPPCAPFGTVPTKPDKQCVMNLLGTFLPAPREMRAVIEGLQSQNPALPGALTSANGLFYGQYHAPILEYIFPENVPGTPIVENNFNTIPFLTCGGYSSSGIGAVGTTTPPTASILATSALVPWPSNVPAPTSGCVNQTQPPSITSAIATPSSVISGTGQVVTLSATATGTAPLTFVWTQAATDTVQVVLTPVAGTNNVTFVTPVVAANTTLNFTVTVSNAAGSASAPVAVGVSVDRPVVNHVPPQSQFSGIQVVLPVSGVDPGNLPLTFTVTANPVPTPVGVAVTQNSPAHVPPNAAVATFTQVLAQGQSSLVINITVVATNSAGVSSAPEFTTVTINPQPDSVVITSAEYRISKQRLIVNATSSVISPNVVLTLAPYPLIDGTIFDPCSLGSTNCVLTNSGGGLYLITSVGSAKPACKGQPLDTTNYNTPCTIPAIKVTSSLGGFGTSVLTRIRQ